MSRSDYLNLQIILLGDSWVGKSCFRHRLMDDDARYTEELRGPGTIGEPVFNL